jgi:hypothetical protein
MPSTVLTPYDYALELLAIANNGLAATTQGAISRAFVSAGLPAIDCVPQLTVHVAGTGSLPTRPLGPLDDGHSRNYGLVRTVTFWVTVARCAPVPGERGEPPSATAQQAIARIVDQDIWAIVNAIYQRDREGALFDGACSEVFHEGGTPLDPSGGALGWIIRMRCSIQGTGPIYSFT